MSYTLAFTASDPAERWAEAGDAAAALVAGERDGIANMANIAALIWQAIPDLNWAGFYRFDGTELVLGPFQGKAACIRIALDKGVCGAAARLRATQRVEDVHAFPGHIACDADSRSELVVPVIANDRRSTMAFPPIPIHASTPAIPTACRARWNIAASMAAMTPRVAGPVPGTALTKRPTDVVTKAGTRAR